MVWRRARYFRAEEASHPAPEVIPVDEIAIAQEVSRSGVPSECLDDLLGRPVRLVAHKKNQVREVWVATTHPYCHLLN